MNNRHRQSYRLLTQNEIKKILDWKQEREKNIFANLQDIGVCLVPAEKKNNAYSFRKRRIK